VVKWKEKERRRRREEKEKRRITEISKKGFYRRRRPLNSQKNKIEKGGKRGKRQEKERGVSSRPPFDNATKRLIRDHETEVGKVKHTHAVHGGRRENQNRDEKGKKGWKKRREKERRSLNKRRKRKSELKQLVRIGPFPYDGGQAGKGKEGGVKGGKPFSKEHKDTRG